MLGPGPHLLTCTAGGPGTRVGKGDPSPPTFAHSDPRQMSCNWLDQDLLSLDDEGRG